MKKSDGFTLIELLVGILCAALVTGAAMTLLLMGMRSNRALLDANSEQQTVRIITSMVESLASEGNIDLVYSGAACQPIENDYIDYDLGLKWVVLANGRDTPILLYSSNKDTIYTSDSNTLWTPLMTGVKSSTISASNASEGDPKLLGGSLLTFSIETEKGTYEITTYCRTSEITFTET